MVRVALAALFATVYAVDELNTDSQLSMLQYKAKKEGTPASLHETADAKSKSFQNDWDQEFTFECPDNKAITGMYSVHDNNKEDRRWKFDCGGSLPLDDCEWTEDTKFDQEWDFDFGHKVLAGVWSRHDNSKEDRIFRWKSCKAPGSHNCKLQRDSSARNDFDRELEVNLPVAEFFQYVWSRHDNSKEDRQWMFGSAHRCLGSPAEHPPITHAPVDASLNAFVNELKQPLDFECPANQAITGLFSEHHNWEEDRKWKFSCGGSTLTMENCQWNDYSQYDQVIDVDMGTRVLTGVKAEFAQANRDRKYRFKSCEIAGTNTCGFGRGDKDYKNDWDKELKFNLPSDEFINYVRSYHDNSKEDRRWQFGTVTKCTETPPPECVDYNVLSTQILRGNCGAAAAYCTGSPWSSIVTSLCPQTCGTCSSFCANNDAMMQLWAQSNPSLNWPSTCAQGGSVSMKGVYIVACGADSIKCNKDYESMIHTALR